MSREPRQPGQPRRRAPGVAALVVLAMLTATLGLLSATPGLAAPAGPTRVTNGAVDGAVDGAVGGAVGGAAARAGGARGPLVTRVTPARGSARGGFRVVLRGRDLRQVSRVVFGHAAGRHLRAHARRVTVIAPRHRPGPVRLHVLGPHGRRIEVRHDRIRYLGAPRVTVVTPASGSLAGGTTVTLTGTELRGSPAVTFGGVPGTSVHVLSSTRLIVTSPAHLAGPVAVQVRTPGGSSATTGPGFTYLPVVTAGPVTTAPLPAGASDRPDVHLSDVACSGPGWCAAVGSFTRNDASIRPLAEVLGGGTWSGSELPLPADASAGQVEEVSCASSLSCVAVGAYTTASGRRPLLETYDGISWAAVPVGLPAGVTSDVAALTSVSCPSPTFCGAVGFSEGGQVRHPLLVALDHGVAATTTDGDAASAAPADLSCPAASDCVAVGTRQDSSKTNAVAYRLSGPTWSATALPAPSDAVPDSTSLTSVSCAAPGRCTAVGTYGNAQTHPGLVETLGSSGTWSATAVHDPDGDAMSFAVELEAVSCPVVDDCVAAGDHRGAGADVLFPYPLTATLSGTPTATGLALPPDATGYHQQSVLRDIVCHSPSSCLAVGEYSVGPGDTAGPVRGLLAAYPAGQGLSAPSPSVAGSHLSGVAAESRGASVAVGEYTTTHGEEGLLLTGLP